MGRGFGRVAFNTILVIALAVATIGSGIKLVGTYKKAKEVLDSGKEKPAATQTK